jgi:hypothetical protein
VSRYGAPHALRCCWPGQAGVLFGDDLPAIHPHLAGKGGRAFFQREADGRFASVFESQRLTQRGNADCVGAAFSLRREGQFHRSSRLDGVPTGNGI